MYWLWSLTSCFSNLFKVLGDFVISLRELLSHVFYFLIHDAGGHFDQVDVLRLANVFEYAVWSDHLTLVMLLLVSLLYYLQRCVDVASLVPRKHLSLCLCVRVLSLEAHWLSGFELVVQVRQEGGGLEHALFSLVPNFHLLEVLLLFPALFLQPRLRLAELPLFLDRHLGDFLLEFGRESFLLFHQRR